jgi:competence protein ComFC
MFVKLKENLLDLFFPPKCIVCGNTGTFLCDICEKDIVQVNVLRCPACKKVSLHGQYCPMCRNTSNLRGIITSGHFKDELLKNMVHKYKYEGLYALAPVLARRLVVAIKKEGIRFDAITFVPISKKRERERGYNQSRLLAKEIASIYRRPILLGLTKTKETKPQVGLDKKKRGKNILGSFRYFGRNLVGKKILLIDDVYTTGATLNECALALKKRGAKSVYGAVIAKE